MLKKSKWIWAGVAILLLVTIAFLWRYFKEGFENVTGKSKSFVVFGALSTITNLENQNKMGSIEKGSFNTSYAISTITDYKGTEVWKAGQTPSTDETKKQYRLNFPSEITISLVDNSNVPAKTVEVFFPKLAAAIPTTDLSYVGDDFNSDYIIVKGDPGVLIDPFNTGNPDNNFKGTLSSLGGKDIRSPEQSSTSGKTIVVGKASSDYTVSRILNEAQTIFYNKSDFGKRDFYKVLFDKDVDLKRIQNFIALAKSSSSSSDESAMNKALSQSSLKLLSLKGVDPSDTTTDFTGKISKSVIFEGPLYAVLNPATREFMKYFSTAGATTTDAAAKLAD